MKTIEDDRTEEEIKQTIGFWVATDKAMSGWGQAPRKSYVACPVTSADDSDIVEKRFRYRTEFIRVRYITGRRYYPKMREGDHLHIYNTKSFRYDL